MFNQKAGAIIKKINTIYNSFCFALYILQNWFFQRETRPGRKFLWIRTPRWRFFGWRQSHPFSFTTAGWPHRWWASILRGQKADVSIRLRDEQDQTSSLRLQGATLQHAGLWRRFWTLAAGGQLPVSGVLVELPGGLSRRIPCGREAR